MSAARDSGILRRVKSWTFSRSEARSEVVGEVKPWGCLEANVRERGRRFAGQGVGLKERRRNRDGNILT